MRVACTSQAVDLRQSYIIGGNRCEKVVVAKHDDPSFENGEQSSPFGQCFLRAVLRGVEIHATKQGSMKGIYNLPTAAKLGGR